MKKNLIIAVLGMMIVSSFAYAAIQSSFKAPRDSYGNQLDSGYYGRSYKAFSNSVTETQVCSGPCVVYGMSISSGSTSTYIILADTTAVNGTGTAIFGHIPCPGANAMTTNALPVPFKTTIGLSIDASAQDGQEVVVYYDLIQ